MDRLRRAALLTRLIEKLRERDNWCGETHIQKATFFAQELMRVPLGFEFILYKHGAFSFDLRDDLSGMRADGLIEFELRRPGPRIVPTQRKDHIQRCYQKTLNTYEERMRLVADWLGTKKTAELERLSTALLVRQRVGANVPAVDRAERMVTLKPHVTRDLARAAVEEVDHKAEEIEAWEHVG